MNIPDQKIGPKDKLHMIFFSQLDSMILGQLCLHLVYL